MHANPSLNQKDMVVNKLNNKPAESTVSDVDRLKYGYGIGITLEYPSCPEIDQIISQLKGHRNLRPAFSENYLYFVGERWRHNKVNVRPKWANGGRIKAVYEEAIKIRHETDCAVHVDHIVPINGVFVCGFHCESNLAIIPAKVNSRKSNVIWPDMPDYALLSHSEFRELKLLCESASKNCAEVLSKHGSGNYLLWRQQLNLLENALREYCEVLDRWRRRSTKTLRELVKNWGRAGKQRYTERTKNTKLHRLSAALAVANGGRREKINPKKMTLESIKSEHHCEISNVLQEKGKSVLTQNNTIDHTAFARLVDAGAVRGIDVIGHAWGWGVVIKYGMTERTLAARRGTVRKFRKFETLVSYLRELGIYQYSVNAADFDPQALKVNRTRPDASERMHSAFEAKAHADWISEKVAESLTDPRPNITHAQVMAEAQDLIDIKTSLN